jgi:hypothetical protein
MFSGKYFCKIGGTWKATMVMLIFSADLSFMGYLFLASGINSFDNKSKFQL